MPSGRFIPNTLSLVLSLGFVTAGAQVQTTNGRIQGDVTDTSGAFIPGAAVEADEVAPQTVSTSTTDRNGHFEFP